MVRQDRKATISQNDNPELGDVEQAWRALGRIIARRHLRNQLAKFMDNTNENTINDDDNRKASRS